MARLLIVDDEKNIRRHLETFFVSCGHEVRLAESGAEALKAIAQGGPPDLVLSDFRMAEMNGLELLNEIKRGHPETLVVLMTAFGTVENAVSAMKAGAYDYLTKPFTLDQIRHVIDRALEVKSLRSENRHLREALEDAPLVESKSPLMASLLETARRAASSAPGSRCLNSSGHDSQLAKSNRSFSARNSA